MRRFTEADFDDALGLVRACDQAADLPDFRTRVLGVAELMPSNAVAYNEADVVTGLIEAEVRPRWMAEPRWRRAMARHSHQHPLVARIAETGDLSPWAISDLVSEKEFHATDLYREFFSPLEIEDQIAFGLPSSPRMVLGVSLNRPSRGFSSEERALLTLIAPHLGDAYLAARARTVVAAGAEEAPPGEHLIVLDADGSVTVLVGAPAAILGLDQSALAPGDPLPPELASWIARLDEELGRSAEGHRVRVDHERTRVAVRRFDGGYPGAERIVRVQEEREAVTPELAGELAISPREAEVANLLARGLSDRRIAEYLTISPHTVKRHLERIYAKLEVGSRAAALARLLSP